MDTTPPALLLVIGLAAGALVGALFVYVRLRLGLAAAIERARRQSVEQSRSTLRGKMVEQMAPLLPGFPYSPADARFLGDPVDYVVFNHYAALKDDPDAPADEVEIVILDVKYGRSQLSPGQRAIARAVERGRVRFEVVHIDDDGTVAVQAYRPSKRAR